jgi:hypothetical protein
MTAPAASPSKRRHFITLDLPPEQVAWLDAQAAGLMSRSAFARVLIARAMQADASDQAA